MAWVPWEVVVVDYFAPLREYYRLVLDSVGYAVTMPPTYAAALGYLRTCRHPVVTVVANTTPDNHLAADFFATVMVGGHALRRHRYVLLTTTAEYVSPALHAHLTALGAPMVRKPALREHLLVVVQDAAHALS